MSHLPVNHPLRPVYRVVSVLVAGWLLVFGAVSLGSTQGQPWFGQGDWSALGLTTNRAHAVFSLLVGALVLLAALVGRNFDRTVNLWVGVGLLAVGTAFLGLSHTEANLLNFTVPNTAVVYLLGMVLLAAGLYGRVDLTAEGRRGSRRRPPSRRQRHGRGRRPAPPPERECPVGRAVPRPTNPGTGPRPD